MKPLIIAHRGASAYERENTLNSFRRAMEMRADMIEFDVRRTGDGVMVVHHDAEAGGRPIASMTMTEVRDLAGRIGYEIPTLAAVLDLAAGGIRVNIELKEAGYEEQVVEAVTGTLTPDRYFVSSSLDRAVKRIREIDGDIVTGLILSSRPLRGLATSVFPAARVRDTGVSLLSVDARLLRFGLLGRAESLGLPVYVWTVNDRKALWRLISPGRVEGVFTDRPDVGLFVRDMVALAK